jgi:hypothetical protein
MWGKFPAGNVGYIPYRSKPWKNPKMWMPFRQATEIDAAFVIAHHDVDLIAADALLNIDMVDSI